MKKRIYGVIGIVFIGAAIMAGCGSASNRYSPEEVDIRPGTEVGNVERYLLPEDDDILINNEYASDEEYPQLAQFLISYYEIPEEYQQETRYYYNYTDLNEDGTNEIFAVVIGEYTSGSGGDCAVILKQEEEHVFSVMESFQFFRTPVIISKKMTNGWHEIVLEVYGGGIDPGFIICHFSENGGYQTEENEFVEELPEDTAGFRILSNNLIDDLDKGRYLTLAPRDEAQEGSEQPEN